MMYEAPEEKTRVKLYTFGKCSISRWLGFRAASCSCRTGQSTPQVCNDRPGQDQTLKMDEVVPRSQTVENRGGVGGGEGQSVKNTQESLKIQVGEFNEIKS